MSLPKNLYPLALLIFASSFSAKAETVYIQTAASQTPLFPDGSRIVVAGINDTPTLTLDSPAVTDELYLLTLQPSGGAHANGSESMTDDITVVEDPEFAVNALTNPFPISQTFTESVSGSTATFSASEGATYVIPLTTGHFLIITPLPNANLNANQVVDALFQLTSTDPIPEPSSIFLVAAGLIGLTSIARKRSLYSDRNVSTGSIRTA